MEWSPRRDLNPGPPPYQGGALPLSYMGPKANFAANSSLRAIAAVLMCRKHIPLLPIARASILHQISLLGTDLSRQRTNFAPFS